MPLRVPPKTKRILTARVKKVLANGVVQLAPFAKPLKGWKMSKAQRRSGMTVFPLRSTRTRMQEGQVKSASLEMSERAQRERPGALTARGRLPQVDLREFERLTLDGEIPYGREEISIYMDRKRMQLPLEDIRHFEVVMEKIMQSKQSGLPWVALEAIRLQMKRETPTPKFLEEMRTYLDQNKERILQRFEQICATERTDTSREARVNFLMCQFAEIEEIIYHRANTAKYSNEALIRELSGIRNTLAGREITEVLTQLLHIRPEDTRAFGVPSAKHLMALSVYGQGFRYGTIREEIVSGNISVSPAI